MDRELGRGLLLQVRAGDQQVDVVAAIADGEGAGARSEAALGKGDGQLLHQGHVAEVGEELPPLGDQLTSKECVPRQGDLAVDVRRNRQVAGAAARNDLLQGLFRAHRERRGATDRDAEEALSGGPGETPPRSRDLDFHRGPRLHPRPVGPEPAAQGRAHGPGLEQSPKAAVAPRQRRQVAVLVQFGIVAVERHDHVDVAVARPHVEAEFLACGELLHGEAAVDGPGGEGHLRVGTAAQLEHHAAHAIVGVRRLPVPARLGQRQETLSAGPRVAAELQQPAAEDLSVAGRQRAVPAMVRVLDAVVAVQHPVAPLDPDSVSRDRTRRAGAAGRGAGFHW